MSTASRSHVHILNFKLRFGSHDTTLPPTCVVVVAPLVRLSGATAFPTLSYGAAESKGDVLSQSGGVWGNAEFGYNPLNNNLGASVSSGTAGSANILSSDGEGPGELVGEGGGALVISGGIMERGTL